jgi:hypothetical protein
VTVIFVPYKLAVRCSASACSWVQILTTGARERERERERERGRLESAARRKLKGEVRRLTGAGLRRELKREDGRGTGAMDWVTGPSVRALKIIPSIELDQT